LGGSYALEPTLPAFNQIAESPLDRATRDQLRAVRLRYGWAAAHAAGKQVLEVACGAGVGLGGLARVADRVVGGDIDPSNCATARATYWNRPRIEVLQFAAEQMPFPEGSFDVILLFEALYYLRSPELFFEEVHRLLRPSGVLLLSSVNRRWKGFNRSPFSTRYFDCAELSSALAQAGFTVTVFGAFPETAGWSNRVTGLVRSTAVRLRLIPSTQKSKEWLKRIFYGGLQPIPADLDLDPTALRALQPLAPAAPADHFRYLYWAARPARGGKR